LRTSRAAAFKTRCSGSVVHRGRPANRVTVVQPGKYECGNQLSCDFLTDETCNLTQTTQLVETAAGDLGNVHLHRKLSVQLDAKIADRLHWLMLEPTVRFSSLSGTLPRLEPNQMSSVLVSLSCSRREEHHSPTSVIQLCSVARVVGTSETGVST